MVYTEHFTDGVIPPPPPFPQQRFWNDSLCPGTYFPKYLGSFSGRFILFTAATPWAAAPAQPVSDFPNLSHSCWSPITPPPHLQDYCEPSLHGILNPVHRPFQNICLMFPQRLEADLKCQAHFLRNPHRRQNVVLRNVYGLLADPPTNNHPKEWRTFSPHLDTRRASLW